MDQQRPSFVRQFGTSMARHGLALGLTATVGALGVAHAPWDTQMDTGHHTITVQHQEAHPALSPLQFGH